MVRIAIHRIGGPPVRAATAAREHVGSVGFRPFAVSCILLKDMYDLVIIGAGPAGLAAARDARRLGLDVVVLDRGLVADTIHQFPIGKLLFSTAEEIELAPGALVCRGPKPTREELLTHYTRFVVDEQLPVRCNEPVTHIERTGEGFTVATPSGTYRSRTVLMATGINGFRRHLNVPGESDARVQYRFVEAYPYAGRPVLVAGSGNSAAEAALFLEEVGARVTLAMRRPSFDDDPRTGKPAVKWWVREPLEKLQAAGRLDVLFETTVAAIGDGTVDVESPLTGRRTLACDMVFALLGTMPDLSLLRACGVEIGEDGVPVYDRTTYETGVPGLYVAGHITHERHIKGALAVAPRVVEHIARVLSADRTPA